jgi:single-stranded DNA-binding protein
MSETERVTLVGNLTADPELRYTPSGLPVTSLRIAVTPRSRQDDGTWTDGETSFHTINVWRDQATNAVDSLGKGARVLVVGRPPQAAHLDRRRWRRAPGHRGRRRGARPLAALGHRQGHPHQWGPEGERQPVQQLAAVLRRPETRERGANPAGKPDAPPPPTPPARRWHPCSTPPQPTTVPSPSPATAASRQSAARTPTRPPPPSPTTTATPTPACPLQRTAASHSTTNSRRCTCSPAAGSRPAPPVGSSSPAPKARPAVSGAAAVGPAQSATRSPHDQPSARPKPELPRPAAGRPGGRVSPGRGPPALGHRSPGAGSPTPQPISPAPSPPGPR